MRLATSELGSTLLGQLSSAQEAWLAVAYFNPDVSVLEALRNVPSLSIIISDRFEINDPWKLELLQERGEVRHIPSDRDLGFLHAKVILLRRTDGSRWAMLGSANITRAGLFTNQEACVVLDSEEPVDLPHLDALEAWYAGLRVYALPIDFDLAKAIHQAGRQYRRIARVPRAITGPSAPAAGYWVLKTTAGSNGENYWPNFRAENVVALGWEDLDVDPSTLSLDELRRAVERCFPDLEGRAIGATVSKISNFVRFAVGDLVLICKGYPATSAADVHVYGIARIAGPFYCDTGSTWWTFKHAAAIQVIDQKVSKSQLSRALAKDSLLEAVHALNPFTFAALESLLGEQLGIMLEV